jgi:hypothetical protein
MRKDSTAMPFYSASFLPIFFTIIRYGEKRGLRSENPTTRDPKSVWTLHHAFHPIHLAQVIVAFSREARRQFNFLRCKKTSLSLTRITHRGKHRNYFKVSESFEAATQWNKHIKSMQQRKKIMLKELGVFAAVNAPSCFIQLIWQINMKAPQFSLTAACNEEAACARAQSEGLCMCCGVRSALAAC